MYDSNLQDPWHLVSQLSATFDFPEMLTSAHQRVKEPPNHKYGSYRWDTWAFWGPALKVFFLFSPFAM